MDKKINKYENLIDFKWWTGIEKRGVEAWLENFEEKEEWIGIFILDCIIFYSDDQLDSYIKYLVNQMKANLYESEQAQSGLAYSDDDNYFKRWENYKKQIRIIPAAIDGDTAGSAYLVARKYRPFFGDKQVSQITKIDDAIQSGVKEIIFVDDFSGSGYQMKKFLESEIELVGNNKVKISDLPIKFPEIKFTIALYAIHGKAKKMLENEFSSMNLKFVDLISEDMDFLNADSIMYKNKTEDEIKKIIDCIREKKEIIMNENPEYRKLKNYQLNIPIVFEHGCPNNALLLLYAKTERWEPIFRLGEEYGAV